MAKLPYSRVVNVTLTRNDAFPTRRGFGVALFLQSVAKAGKVDATIRTKLYGSIEEVAADFLSTDQAYIAAEALFSQNPVPLMFKVGYYDATAATTAALLKTQLDIVNEYDQDWYFLTVEAALRDTDIVQGAIEWIQAKKKLALIDSNDVLMQDPADTTNIAAINKGVFDRTGIFYHTSASEYMSVAMAAYMGTRNFDEANSAYTSKFKRLRGVSAVNIGSAAVTAITGFVPGIGQSETAGHCANTYIDIGNKDFVVEGSTLTQNVFLDEIHASDWIVARTEEEMLGIFLNNARIPFTDRGMETVASAARSVMRQAFRAGLVADDLDSEGNYSPAYEVTVPSVFSVPESQRKSRIAPAIAVRFRYPGAVHYATINYQMTF